MLSRYEVIDKEGMAGDYVEKVRKSISGCVSFKETEGGSSFQYASRNNRSIGLSVELDKSRRTTITIARRDHRQSVGDSEDSINDTRRVVSMSLRGSGLILA